MANLDMALVKNKLSAVRDRPSDEPVPCPESPSLASTSSDALQYHTAVYQTPVTEEEQARRAEARERTLSFFWGDKATRNARDEKLIQERKELQTLGMLGWGVSDEYKTESSKLAMRRTAEDRSRFATVNAGGMVWTENQQRVVELGRLKEDYDKLAQSLSIFLAGDVEAGGEDVLQYRLRNLKALLESYTSRWDETSKRLRETSTRLSEAAKNNKISRAQHPVKDGMEGRGQIQKRQSSTGGRAKRPSRTSGIEHPSIEGTPRMSLRSRRTVKDTPKTASTSATGQTIPSKPSQGVTRNRRAASSARPQGISKAKPATTTRNRGAIKQQSYKT